MIVYCHSSNERSPGRSRRYCSSGKRGHASGFVTVFSVDSVRLSKNLFSECPRRANFGAAGSRNRKVSLSQHLYRKPLSVFLGKVHIFALQKAPRHWSPGSARPSNSLP